MGRGSCLPSPTAQKHTSHAFVSAQSGITPDWVGVLLSQSRRKTQNHVPQISSHVINGVGAASISRFLSTTSHLQQLNLSENHYIGDEGARELALSLSHNSCLEVLCLKSCGIGQSGAKRFADPLAQNTSLKSSIYVGLVRLGTTVWR
ncbi:hypothetical protein GBAR_LOCUS15232 [Geodia barretti]|uniref:Uncharacterized protein n=1 Tax=Geodia barretti TaxID=519541 RepID=A0AA35SAK8_GEOBA|nr:hypothetical protein GBAR_LOCUS15232 [Geodia barretti]